MTALEHWQHIYMTRPPADVGWYEPDPIVSRRLVSEAIARGARSVIDVGGGASFLVDQLLDQGLQRMAVLDIAAAGLELSKRRLGERGASVEWIVADVTTVEDVGRFEVWHDRAVFHFLTSEEDRQRYVALAGRTILPGGTLIVATFAPDGPERCSGLPVRRYDTDELGRAFGPAFRMGRSEDHLHVTPGGVRQSFVYVTLSRIGS